MRSAKVRKWAMYKMQNRFSEMDVRKRIKYENVKNNLMFVLIVVDLLVCLAFAYRMIFFGQRTFVYIAC